ncbi:MAG: YjjG family noncanonical pyrimidine nucleotidase, partial [Ferruginibacter sp.]
MSSYKHLFFDLDHTLWDFDSNAKATLQELYNNELAQKTGNDFDLFLERYLFHNAHLWKRYEAGFIGVEELKWKRMWRTLLDFKVADEALSKDLSIKFLDILPTKKEVFPHTFEILTYLKNKNYTLHLITNGFEHTQKMKLKNSGLHPYFDELITSEASNSLKPKKEIFDYAIMKTNALLNQSLMLGDNQAADIQGAINAGMD